jgi:hypothetical protein
MRNEMNLPEWPARKYNCFLGVAPSISLEKRVISKDRRLKLTGKSDGFSFHISAIGTKAVIDLPHFECN